jgi:hypothetical protein
LATIPVKKVVTLLPEAFREKNCIPLRRYQMLVSEKEKAIISWLLAEKNSSLL